MKIPFGIFVAQNIYGALKIRNGRRNNFPVFGSDSTVNEVLEIKKVHLKALLGNKLCCCTFIRISFSDFQFLLYRLQAQQQQKHACPAYRS